MRFTEKYIRTDSQWVKVTRDNKAKTFTFAKGYKGQFSAYAIETLSFKWVANWTEAKDRATKSMAY
jgi:hypothetical protein